MRFIGIIAIGALTLSACATQDFEESGSPNRPLAVDLVCPADPGGLMLGVSPATARQGTTLTLNALLYRGPMGPVEVPVDCLRDLAVSPAESATLASRGGAIRIADDATPGSLVTISGRFRDAPASVSVRVVGRDEVVLTGTWRQDQVKCDPGRAPGEPVRELRIDDKGTFGVTYLPFESYTDFWGPMTFDQTTGAVVLTPEDGNFTPPILDGEGIARLEDARRLVLEGVYLGDRNERNFEPRMTETGEWVTDADGRPIVDKPVCTYVFVR